MSLEEAIQQLVNLGESDPWEIAKKIEKRNGREWVKEALSEHAEDLIADMARRQLGAIRRRAEVALRPGDTLAEAEFKIAKTWVPGTGWKAAGDLTSFDLLAKATWYESAAQAAAVRSAWCREVARLMEMEGAEKLSQLKAELPALPDADSVLELVG